MKVVNEKEGMGVRVIEFAPEYAASLAQMWNASGEAWNNAVINLTEEAVLSSLSRYQPERHWIAVEGGEVLGTVFLEKKRGDSQALYVESFNVRPDRHGKGIGKALLHRCVRHAIETGYARIDLDTWGGNERALPLYKKSGFKLEDSGAISLRNFIPGLYRNALTKAAMDRFDWYADSTCELVDGPDEIEEDGRSVFRYEWRNGDIFARATFEHPGGGLVAFETERYSIALSAARDKAVSDEAYGFELRVESGVAGEVRASALSIPGVRVDIGDAPGDSGSLAFHGRFRASMPDDALLGGAAPAPKPAYGAVVSIDGLGAAFSRAIAVVRPASASVSRPKALTALGRDAGVSLSLENNLPHRASFVASIACDGALALEGGEFRFELEPGQRDCQAVPAIVRAAGMCSLRTEVRELASGKAWTLELPLELPALASAHSGRVGEEWSLSAGKYRAAIKLSGEDVNRVEFGLLGQDSIAELSVPKLLSPLTESFNQRPPESIAGKADGARAEVTLRYESESSGAGFARVLALSADGTLEQHFTADQAMSIGGKKVGCYLNPFPVLDRFPYAGRILASRLDGETEPDPEAFDEPWSSGYDEFGTVLGLTWDRGANVKLHSSAFWFECGLEEVAASGRSPSTRVHYGSFSTIEELRSYAVGGDAEPRLETGRYAVGLSSVPGAIAGPGAEPRFEAVMPATHEKVEFSAVGDRGTDTAATWDPEADSYDLTRSTLASGGVELVETRIVTAGLIERKRRLALRIDAGRRVETRMRGSEYVVDSGAIEFALDPEFSFGIHSLRSAEGEWLDTEYPEKPMRAWYCDWTGGISYWLPPDYGLAFADERRSAAFFTAMDRAGREWTGVESICDVSGDGPWKGCRIRQRFATLPGLPLARTDCVIENRSGAPIDAEVLQIGFYKPGNLDGAILWAAPDSGMGFRLGGSEGWDEIVATKLFALEAEGRRERLYLYAAGSGPYAPRRESNGSEKIARTDSVRRLRIGSGEARACEPDWILADARELSQADFAEFEYIPAVPAGD
jgi:ribosomal protein S18 acetylase RimI-like enzyme